MVVVLRFISLVLVGIGLMLLGADLVTSLERHGAISVRSLEQVWTLTSQSSAAAFHAWAERSLPSSVSGWIGAVLALPAWAPTGVLGVVLAFLFGRRPEEV
ncbi:MAG TPA: hypothetical protein VII49_13095 [Rhizomicrobium sp.]